MKTISTALMLFFLFLANLAQAAEPAVRVTVLVDNTSIRKDLRSVWGFACLVETKGHAVLFDTGADPAILKDNMKAMKVSPASIEAVVFSHIHGDHTKGAPGLGLRAGLRAFTPHSFEHDGKVLAALDAAGLQRVPVFAQTPVCEGMTLPEPLLFGRSRIGDWEQCLVIDSPRGLVVVVGCSHPGIVKMIELIRKQFAKPVYLVFGGFHLGGRNEGDVREIAAALQSMGVRRVGATHCTGETSSAILRKAYGSDFVQGGVGTVIEVPFAAADGAAPLALGK